MLLAALTTSSILVAFAEAEGHLPATLAHVLAAEMFVISECSRIMALYLYY